jgi:tRNA modification GTPase
MREGLRIAIVGPPNSGKSSLLNALLGSDRAIVTDIPGTTRDFVEESADLGGVPCVLIDTAGLRETTDPVEALGVQRTRAQAANADVVWYVFDSSAGWRDSDSEAVGAFDRPVTVLANKADLVCGLRPAVGGPSVPISALTGQGLSELVASLRQLADAAPEQPFINDRHVPLLARAREALRKAREVLRADIPTDLLSTCLQDAGDALGQITGETASAEMLEAVFSRFCIGK